MDSYITVLKHSSFEYEDRKSIFIGEALPCKTEDEALKFIENVKKRYPDAKHHVYAYVLRENSIMRFSDDREPQGTAGMPVLDSIRKRGCTDTVVVVTRYFGGTLLGTGGLVKAYTTAAVGAIESAEIIKYDLYSEIVVEAGYSDFQKLAPIFDELSFRVDSTMYTDKVEINGRISSKDRDILKEKIATATSARAKLEIISEKFDF